jgi:hypothetical protein
MSGGRALQAGDWIVSYRIEAISGRAGLGRPELIQALEAVFGQTFTLQDPDGYAITIHDKG